MSAHYENLIATTNKLKDLYQPEFFRLKNSADEQAFDSLLAEGNIFVHDEVYDQLKEFLRSQRPKERLMPEDYTRLIETHLAGTPIHQYGVWVYYPWNRRVVHILDEAEFIEVRTSRNQYKITIAEREVLAKKKVGVIGLSVGQSVSLTMAMERSFGEIRLADFDVLELTNLNRIRTGLANLGIKKVVAVAREIAEIDPFLKVIIFPHGLTEENMDDYFLGGGKLDVLIDECDGVDIKILCRHKAKSLQIPVLMEASDRTTIDVERFDLEPNRSILHGLIDHLDVHAIKHLKTNEERVPYLAPMVGIDTMSVRLKASAIEVGQSITTWPQLASAVALGGGAIADIWRRVALDLYHGSGRFHVDMEEIAGDNKIEKKYNVDEHIPVKALTSAESILSSDVVKDIKAITPSNEVIADIVSCAATAPSGGNSQPWKWVYRNGVLTLLHDQYYSWSFMDFRDRSSYIALGAAIENAVIRAHSLGLEVLINYFPNKNDKKVIAAFSFYAAGTEQAGIEPHIVDGLAGSIKKRHTNRKVPPRTSVPASVLQELQSLGESIDGAKVQFIEEQAALDELGDIVSVTDRFRLLYPQSHNDFTYQEMRWSEDEAKERRTGMAVNTLELKPSELVGLRLIKDPKVVAFLRHIDGGNIFRNVSRKLFSTASAAGFLTMPSFSEIDFINGGRASQRIWLKATELGIAFQVVNVPLPFFARLQHDISDLPGEIVAELKSTYDRFTSVLDTNGRGGEIYLFRIFNAETPVITPLLRPMEDVLVFA